MDVKIANLAIVLTIALFLPSARAFRCYACTTTNDRNSECAVLNNLQTTLCTVRAYEKLAKVPFPIEIKKIFEAVPQDSYPVTEWSCGKLELADTNTGYGPTTNYTIRTCLPKFNGPDFCDRTRDILEANPTYQPYQVSHCSECQKDSCNGI
ncbi:uncharacterized protein LOC117181739 [Belonocnema kinseyi]|uniref:uncharacterized protein LOC117181739 n=1 Tax=Belonocnema kinseyi TaxID=2817044 RepID=UPI00143CE007|nr:uncharacterized protein LOC117181739 [Belonocnema kinseyi]